VARVDPIVARTGAGALAVVAVSWAMASRGVARWEQDAGRWAFDLPDWTTGPLEVVMQAGTRVAPLAVAALLVAFGWRWRALAVAAAGFLAWGLSRLAKEVVDRPRPDAATLGRRAREVVEGPGYPSTHAAVAAGVAMAVVLLGCRRPAVAIAVMAVAALTALARMHLGVHWTVDVVGGAGIGVVAACAAGAAAGSRR
jgi:membrane-associated phospholipid phosphatase